MTQQLPLALTLTDHALLSDFCWGSNKWLQQALETMLQGEGERLLYLWGPPGSGKTHLLQACCQACSLQHAAAYLPLALLKGYGAEVLENFDKQRLLCIDDIEAIAQDTLWEEEIFHLYNKVKDEGNSFLLISGKVAPAALPLKLADLRSRLGGALVIQVQELTDEEKIAALQKHAEQRGLALPTAVAQFLVSRCARNMHHLQQLLARLDEASLAAQRKITVPFVKGVLGL